MFLQYSKGNHFACVELVALLVLTFSFCAKAVSLPDGPLVGQMAPPLKLRVWLQAPPEAALGWPTGKVVVLEFWSTDCGPCVAQIPHLNQLADAFAGKPVQFIAVTDDKPSVIKRFLKKTPIHAWLGMGPQAGLGEDTPYKVYGIPHTVLIDPRGRIAAVIDPWMLSVSIIQMCLDGTQFAVQHKKGGVIEYHWEGSWDSSGGQSPGLVPGQYNAGIKPIYQIMIRATPTNSSAGVKATLGGFFPADMYHQPVESWIPGMALTAQNDTLNRAIQIVFDVKPTHIVTEANLPTEKYDFYISTPRKQKTAFEAMFSQAVAATFGLNVERKTRDIDVLVLRTNSASLETLAQCTDPKGLYSAFCDEAAATNQPLKALADELEVSSSMPVLDETGLTNHYNFDIKWKQKDYAHPNIKGMIGAVKGLSLELVSVKQSAEVVVVGKAPQGQ